MINNKLKAELQCIASYVQKNSSWRIKLFGVFIFYLFIQLPWLPSYLKKCHKWKLFSNIPWQLWINRIAATTDCCLLWKQDWFRVAKD